MDSDDNSDEWGTEELPSLPVAQKNERRHLEAAIQDVYDDATEDAYWEPDVASAVAVATSISREQHPATTDERDEGYPMLLVDMTILSNGEIHSKFDPSAVNDPVAVKKLRTEMDFAECASDAALLANRTVVPCGSTVWRAALASLRRETPGHYWCPVFPPR